MIYEDSRYAKMEVALDAEGRPYIVGRRRMPKTDWPDNRAHTVKDGDTLWMLAWQYLGDAEYWWVIADFNNIKDPWEPLEAGRILIIPSERTLREEILS
ncbi:MAG TPA: LysM peptidoglycan-binding domain-containing protein [Firmicutes bacterium]|nr:LysM peptidoglycan-binding domain-containing protein [Bacillota bacterium]